MATVVPPAPAPAAPRRRTVVRVRAVGRAVPVARRNLFVDRRRAALSVGGVSAGLLLVLVLRAVYAGFFLAESAYSAQAPADVVVSQAGVRTMQMTVSRLPDGAAAAAMATDGVAWVEELRQLTATVDADGQRLVTFVFGYDPAGSRGGPQRITDGRLPAAGAAELVLDEAGARQLGVGLGDAVSVLGHELRVVGMTEGLTGVATTATFLRADQLATMIGPGTSYLLVGVDAGADPAAVAARVAAEVPGVTAQSREAFAGEEAAFVEDLYGEVIGTMVLLGFVVAMALVALGLSALTTSTLREHAIVRAIGADRRAVLRVVATQAAWTIGAAYGVAVGAVVLLARLMPAIAPNVTLVVAPRDLVVTLIGAACVAVPGALLPMRKILRLDPAAAFRSAS